MHCSRFRGSDPIPAPLKHERLVGRDLAPGPPGPSAPDRRHIEVTDMATKQESLTTTPPTTSGGFTLGGVLFDEGAALAEYPKGEAPSAHTLRVLEPAKATLPFADTRDIRSPRASSIVPRRRFNRSSPGSQPAVSVSAQLCPTPAPQSFGATGRIMVVSAPPRPSLVGESFTTRRVGNCKSCRHGYLWPHREPSAPRDRLAAHRCLARQAGDEGRARAADRTAGPLGPGPGPARRVRTEGCRLDHPQPAHHAPRTARSSCSRGS